MAHFYFIGIAGTAMASVAVALRQIGHEVTGSDAGVYPPMSDQLAAAGIPYTQGWSAEALHAWRDALPDDVEAEVVVGNAVSRGNPEVEVVLDARLPHTSLAALVGRELIGGRPSVVVTGTHGKTTTTALTAWVLEAAGRAPGFLVGGVPGNFGQGCRAAAPRGVFVTEGDEYDTAFFDKRSKFVHYRPTIAVINNIEFDHADIFPSLEDVVRSFRQFVTIIPSNGLLFWNGDDPVAARVVEQARTKVESFGFGDGCTWRIANVEQLCTSTAFDLLHDGCVEGRYCTPLHGDFNLRNTLAAILVARSLGVPQADIQRGLSSFRSVKRRMEVIGEPGGVTVIDDFAHHPTAVRLTLAALRQRHPGRRVWALFEPRSNTSTRRIFQEEFVEALAVADCVIIGAVNRPDRYAADEMLDTDALVDRLRELGRMALCIREPERIAAEVAAQARPGDVVAILSNGSFGGVHVMVLAGLAATLSPSR